MIELYKKSTKGTKFNITGSFGMRKACNYYRQNGTDKSLLIGREDFSSVIQEVNKRLVDSFAPIGSVEFPAGMGGLTITASTSTTTTTCSCGIVTGKRSEERRVGKECRL